jgi:hypothetical protein
MALVPCWYWIRMLCVVLTSVGTVVQALVNVVCGIVDSMTCTIRAWSSSFHHLLCRLGRFEEGDSAVHNVGCSAKSNLALPPSATEFEKSVFLHHS